MTKSCSVCSRMLHDDDEIIFVGRSVFHAVPSEVLYAIEPPSACYQMAHAYCANGEEVELCQK